LKIKAKRSSRNDGHYLWLCERRCGSAVDVRASLLAGTAARCSRLMAWREAPDSKWMAIRSGDGTARSVRAIRIWEEEKQDHASHF